MGFDRNDHVFFGAKPATVSVASPLTLDAAGPSMGAGRVAVSVVAADGRRVSLVDGYEFASELRFDPNGDCQVSASDVLYLTEFLGHGGAPPVLSGDANGDGLVDQHDVDFLIAHLFGGGPPPVSR